ncbi:MAG: CDP-glycerol glycerophosphotransferase family protein, partial [Staphylococcus equorum]
MIKQIELVEWQHLETQLKKATLEDYTHFVVINNSVKIHPNMIEAVNLKPCTIVSDYTVNQQYINDCRYFGKLEITFNDWVENINHYPNIIFHIETTQRI